MFQNSLRPTADGRILVLRSVLGLTWSIISRTLVRRMPLEQLDGRDMCGGEPEDDKWSEKVYF